LNTYIKLNLNPTTYPDILGLKLIDSINLKTDLDFAFRILQVKEYFEPHDNNNNSYNPKYLRYMIDTISLPTASFSMSGTLFDYKTVSKMSERIIKEKVKKETRVFNYNDIYKKIDSFVSLHPDPTSDTSITEETVIDDSTADKTKINYRDLVVFFSKKAETIITDSSATNVEYSEPVGIDGYRFLGKDASSDAETIILKEYELPNSVTLSGKANFTAQTIDYFDFRLTYSFQNDLVNRLKFNYNEGKDSTPEYDTVQKILTNNFESDLVTESFNINNNLNFSLRGSLNVFRINNGSGILASSPVFSLYYRKDYDILSVYKNYLDNNLDNQTDEYRERLVLDREKQNKNNSELSLFYEDTITTDLSFGKYMFSGTSISTNIKMRLFRFSEIKEYNYTKLNSLNENNLMYTPINPVLYDTNINLMYDKLNSLYTRFTFKSNFIPQGNPHSFSMSVEPKINWIMPTSSLTILKNELWEDQSGDVVYRNSTGTESYEAEAREYVYFHNKNGKKNLNDKINEFFTEDNFWYGPKNYRKMLEDLTFNLNYSFKKDNINYVTMSDTFRIKFEHIGSFSRGDIESNKISILPTALYPDNTFSISFFNDIFRYSNSLTFSKILDTNYLNYTTLTQSERILDEYNIMTFVNQHTINFTLKGDLFPLVKLPKGDWATLSSTTEFRYDKNTIWQNYKTSNNQPINTFYLNRQSVDLSIFMSILKISLNFRAYDFVGSGYGFTFNYATITLGYNVTEIPTLFNFLKILISPSISYTFYANNNNYYESKILQSINNNYFQNNKLNLSFSTTLIIGEATEFETKLTFEMKNYNNKMYTYYGNKGLERFFQDLADSFNFADIDKRRQTNFKLDSILVRLEHNLHDWQLSFTYIGQQERRENAKKYYWENTFRFEIAWKLNTENQLMKMFNKTKVSSNYEKGEWKQPVLSLDPDAN